jgi:hypothetical protein
LITRLILSFLFKLCIDLPLMLLGYVIFPMAYKQRKTVGTLTHFPKWAWMWSNDDHGIDGESFWAKRTVGWPYWKRCFWWTVIRNPTFNASKYLFGLTVHDPSQVVLTGDYPIGDTKAEGRYWARYKLAWEFYYVKAYTVFGLKRCIRFRAGWKIVGRDAGEKAQFVFAPNPFHSYSGK